MKSFFSLGRKEHYPLEMFKSVESDGEKIQREKSNKFLELDPSVKTGYHKLYNQSKKPENKMSDSDTMKMKMVNDFLNGSIAKEDVHKHWGIKDPLERSKPTIEIPEHLKKKYDFTMTKDEKGNDKAVGTPKNKVKTLDGGLFGAIADKPREDPPEISDKEFESVKNYFFHQHEKARGLGQKSKLEELAESKKSRDGYKKKYGEKRLHELMGEFLPEVRDPNRISEQEAKLKEMNKQNAPTMLDPKTNQPKKIEPKIKFETLSNMTPEKMEEHSRHNKIITSLSPTAAKIYDGISKRKKQGTLSHRDSETYQKFHDHVDGKLSTEDLRKHLILSSYAPEGIQHVTAREVNDFKDKFRASELFDAMKKAGHENKISLLAHSKDSHVSKELIDKYGQGIHKHMREAATEHKAKELKDKLLSNSHIPAVSQAIEGIKNTDVNHTPETRMNYLHPQIKAEHERVKGLAPEDIWHKERTLSKAVGSYLNGDMSHKGLKTKMSVKTSPEEEMAIMSDPAHLHAEHGGEIYGKLRGMLKDEPGMKKSFFQFGRLNKSMDSLFGDLPSRESNVPKPKMRKLSNPKKTAGSQTMESMFDAAEKQGQRLNALHPEIKDKYTKMQDKVSRGIELDPEEKVHHEKIRSHIKGDINHGDLKKHFGIKDNVEEPEKPQAKIVDGEWHYGAGGKSLFGGNMGEELSQYHTHSGFLNNPKPEHEELVQQIKKLHKGDVGEIRKHFNKTVGRYEDHTKKHFIPHERQTLMNHDRFKDSPEHGKLSDLHEDYKKEMDEFKTPEEFAEAVKNSDNVSAKPSQLKDVDKPVSSHLLSFLKQYKADHLNPENEENGKPRSWAMFKTNENSQKGEWDDHNLKEFFKFPTTSNRKDVYTDEDTADEGPKYSKEQLKQLSKARQLLLQKKISPEIYDVRREEITLRAKGKKNTEPDEPGGNTLEIRHHPYEPEAHNKYSKGETIHYAGQNHQIKDVGSGHVLAEGDDGKVRKMKIADIENVIHSEEDNDIHHKNFHKALRGRDKDMDMDEFLDEAPKDVRERLRGLGLDHDEIDHVFKHISSVKPKPPKKVSDDRDYLTDTKNEFVPERDTEHDLDNKGNDEYDLDVLKDYFNPSSAESEKVSKYLDSKKRFDENMSEYEKQKNKYEDIIDKHKSTIFNKIHPNKNDKYYNALEDNNTEDYTHLHPLKTISEDSVLSHLSDAGSNAYKPEHILKNMGIEANRYTKNEVKKHLIGLHAKGKASLFVDGQGNVRGVLAKSFDSMATQGKKYINSKVKKMMELIKTEKDDPIGTIEEFAKSFGPRDLWLEVDMAESGVSRSIDKILNLAVNYASEEELSEVHKSFEFEMFLFGSLLKEKYNLMKSYNFDEIEEILPEQVLVKGVDNNFKIGYYDPLGV